MAKVNIFYRNKDGTWWINKNIDGFSLRQYIDENPVGLGTVAFEDGQEDGLYKIESQFIPSYMKRLNGVAEEIEKNGFANAIKINNDEELKEILED